MSEVRIQVGEPCTVKTTDGRTYVGTFTGCAEVGTGEDVMEEIYLKGCGDGRLTLAVSTIESITPGGAFTFPR